MKIFLSLILLLSIAGLAVAEQQGNLPVDYIQMRTAKQLRMVNDGLCGTVPDDAGTTTYSGFRVYCTGKNGVTSGLDGCAVKFYDSKYKEVAHREISPELYTPAPANAVFWERYNCYSQPYTCSDYQSEGCGERGTYVNCADDQMLRVRSCPGAPSSVDTERCVAWYDCRAEENHCDYHVSAWSDCANGVQTRIITQVDCENYEDTQSCVINCDNPYGEAGDMECRDGFVYECGSNGQWAKGNTCGGGVNTCTNPGAEVGQKLCYGGFEKVCSNNGEWDVLGTCTVEKDLKSTFKPLAFYDPTTRKVIGRVGIENIGEDMKDTYLIEMQVRKKGEQPLAFISGQEICDPEHPENVHKQFMLKSGENATIQLEVPESILGEGDFDVYFLSRHKCYKDLTQEHIENYDEYQRVSPFPYSEKVAGITIGDPTKKLSTAKLWKAGAGIFLIAGIALAYFGLIPVGIAAFAIGLIILIWQYWPW